MGFGRTSREPAKPVETAGGAPADMGETTPAIPGPAVAIGKDGNERPLSGGSFIRVNGKLQRREA